ncbi:hypothetical protein WJX75_007320 [Coccomyxa subellipsoidea]|uniref:BZIP domain-containing protein n=1 Tax=Coccomyxa subellipsoidea TaxID=248742 RepID=A0ABR2YEM5_9CHLO
MAPNPDQARPPSRHGTHGTSHPGPPGRSAPAANILSTPGIVTPNLLAPRPGPAFATPSTASGQLNEAALHHVLSGHSAATFLDASGSPRFQGSSGSATLSGRNSLLGSLDSLLAARQAFEPAAGSAGSQQPQASGAQRLLANLLGALRQQQRSAEGGPVPPAAAAAPAQPAPGAQPGGVGRQLSDTSSIQAFLSSVGFKLRTQDHGDSTSAAPKQPPPRQPSSHKGKEAVGESADASAQLPSRELQNTNSLPIPDPELRRILTGDLSARHPPPNNPPESAAVAFKLGQPIVNPFAGFANDVLQRQSSSLASHPPLHWKAAALAAAVQPPVAFGPAQQAKSDTASRRSGDGQREPSAGRGASSKRKAGVDASAEQSAESLPRPSITHVRRALADALDWSASSKPGLARQLSAFHPTASAPTAAVAAAGPDLQRHAGDFLRQMQESMPVAMRSAQSLPPRSSLTADSYRALERSLDAAGQGSGKAIAEEVQRLLGRARAQQAAPPAAAAQAEESDQGGEDSEAPREGEPAADTLEERIKRRRLSNRESARRTRQRRISEMAVLREANEALRADAEKLRAQVADLAAANHALLASIPALSDQRQQAMASENAALKAELLELRAAVTQHLAAHASQLPYAQSIALSQVIEQARRQASAGENEEGSQQ